MKTQRELNLHYWGAIHDMVEAYNKEHPGADVKQWECVKHLNFILEKHSILKDHPNNYQFAVAILFDEQAKVHRPVFPGDTLFGIDNLTTAPFRVIDDDTLMSDALVVKSIVWSKWSWHAPQHKRTFEINGVELPCPVKKFTENQVRIYMPSANYRHGAETIYHFSNNKDACDFFNRLNDLIGKE